MFVQCGQGCNIPSLLYLRYRSWSNALSAESRLKLWHIVLVCTMFPCIMCGAAVFSATMSSCARHSCLQTLCVYHMGMYHHKHELLQQALTLTYWQRHVSSAQGLAKGRGLVGTPALCPVTQAPAPHASWSCSRHATVADLLCLSSAINCQR